MVGGGSFVLIWIAVYFIGEQGLAVAKLLSASSFSVSVPSLHTRRVVSELHDVLRDHLSLRSPFNDTDSKSESGIRLAPVDNKLLEWHFSFTGVPDSPFEGGVYHGRIVLSKDYPRAPPVVALLTPSGRWAVGKDICLSASAHHPESWSSTWNLRTLLLSLRAFMTTPPAEIGGIHSTLAEKKRYALQSTAWRCPQCGTSHRALLVLRSQGRDRGDTVRTNSTADEERRRIVNSNNNISANAVGRGGENPVEHSSIMSHMSTISSCGDVSIIDASSRRGGTGAATSLRNRTSTQSVPVTAPAVAQIGKNYVGSTASRKLPTAVKGERVDRSVHMAQSHRSAAYRSAGGCRGSASFGWLRRVVRNKWRRVTTK